MHKTVTQRPLFSPFFSGKAEKKGPPEATRLILKINPTKQNWRNKL